MITVIVGHRGVGKTQFLSRLDEYLTELGQKAVTVDLDSEIETRTGQKIAEIFSSRGEAHFRALEIQAFADLYEHHRRDLTDVYIALGAGFSGELPANVEVWWLRRATDSFGRIFLDRPRLNADVSALEEYQLRYEERQPRFRQLAHRQFVIGEGFDQRSSAEAALVGFRPADIGASITVLPWHFENPIRLELFIERFLQMGVRFFELRDDWLSEKQIREFATQVPSEKVLLAFRAKETSKSLIEFAGSFKTDWAIELGESPFLHNAVVSLHTRLDAETVDEAAARLLRMKADHHKLAVEILDFTELWVGHRFYKEAPETRSFLPISPDGRWQWYRLTQHRRMHINFVRETVEASEAPFLDQPFVFDFLRYASDAQNFAAVLGDPIAHSRTPAEQTDFFAKRQMGVVALPMRENECNSLNLSVLERMGLRAAAVTAPLKVAAYKLAQHLDKKASDVGAVNTLAFLKSGWHATNTDLVGLARVFHALKLSGETAVWGGGGTRLVLKALLPSARYFSARKATEIWGSGKTPTEFSPQTLIWAVGRARMGTSYAPPDEWRPKFVFDLNYSEDSPGRDYATRVGARYYSGIHLFRAQAEAQREFWSNEFREVGLRELGESVRPSL